MIKKCLFAKLTTLFMIISCFSAAKMPVTTNKDNFNLNSNAKELLESGMSCLYNGNTEEGRKILRNIEYYFPSSLESSSAKLAIADSFFFDKDDHKLEAITEYTSYIDFFPNSPHLDYVLFHISACLYDAVNKIERHQTETIKAIAALQKLLYYAPNSIYAADTKNKLQICQRRLADTELRVAIFYSRNFNYEIAIKRIKEILATQNGYIDYKKAYFFLAESLYKDSIRLSKAKAKMELIAIKTKNKPLTKKSSISNDDQSIKNIIDIINNRRCEAKTYYQQLIDNYPNTTWATRANNRLIDMGQLDIQGQLDS